MTNSITVTGAAAAWYYPLPALANKQYKIYKVYISVQNVDAGTGCLGIYFRFYQDMYKNAVTLYLPVNGGVPDRNNMLMDFGGTLTFPNTGVDVNVDTGACHWFVCTIVYDEIDCRDR